MDQKESGPAKDPGPDQNKSGRFRQTFASLKERNFRIYATGQLISLIGTWMQITALPWLVYTITKSASALGMVSFAGSLPLLLLTYFGGTLADKFDRKKVLITMQSLAMVQAVLLFAVAFYGLTSIYLLVALALFSGCITALDLPSRQAFVADLVGKELRLGMQRRELRDVAGDAHDGGGRLGRAGGKECGADGEGKGTEKLHGVS